METIIAKTLYGFLKLSLLIHSLMLAACIAALLWCPKAQAQTTTTTTLLPSQIKLVDVCKMLDATKATGQMKTKILDARTKAGCP